MVLPDASVLVVGTGWALLGAEKPWMLPMLASRTVAVISFIVAGIFEERRIEEDQLFFMNDGALELKASL